MLSKWGDRLGRKLLFVIVASLLVALTGCREDGGSDGSAADAQLVSAAAMPSELSSLYGSLQRLDFEGDAANRQLMQTVTAKLGLIEDDSQRKTLADDLKLRLFKTLGRIDAARANRILDEFSARIDALAQSGGASSVQTAAFGSLNASQIRVVVSDGITRRGSAGAKQEILPNATVYAVAAGADDSLINYVTAKRVAGAPVQFYYRQSTVGQPGEWRKLGGLLVSGSDGRVRLSELAPLIADDVFTGLQGEADLQLKAEIVAPGGLVSDEKGLVRILAGSPRLNRRVILTDHDNTLHETGGPNTPEDMLDSANCLKKEWPLVDATAPAEVSGWLNAGNDMIIVTGMSENMRAKAREQMGLHFEGGCRRVPIIVKHDTDQSATNTFKAETIAILKNLYGDGNIAAMVGDTVRQDGYGAFANSVAYVPFQIHYKLNALLLDSIGYGAIDPQSIAWTWQEVIDRIEAGGLIPANFWRRNNAFMNIAHRGGGKLAPEDTLEAYRNAIRVGADAIEGDCHLTKDGVLVISHDATVDRCTDGSGAIENLTFAELRKLDAGYRFTPDGGSTYPYRGKGVKIPSVREVFELLTSAEFERVPMVLELKSEHNRDLAVRKLMDLIQEFDQGSGRLVNRLQLGAFNQEALNYMKTIGGSAPYNFDIVRCFATEGVTDFVLRPVWQLTYPDYARPGEVLDLPYAIITPLTMDKARRTGLNVYVWTVNSRLEMLWLKNVMHVDGVMTDDPSLLADVIAGS